MHIVTVLVCSSEFGHYEWIIEVGIFWGQLPVCRCGVWCVPDVIFLHIVTSLARILHVGIPIQSLSGKGSHVDHHINFP
jgi:hypothetical protein